MRKRKAFPAKSAGIMIALLSIPACQPIMRSNPYDPANAGGKVAMPYFIPEPGIHSGGQQVTMGCNTPGAMIYYTGDGSTPSESSPRYTAAIVITQTTTLKAIATKAGMTSSDVATAAYTISSPLSDAKDITSFGFLASENQGVLAVDVTAVINGTGIAATVLSGISRTTLIATFATTGSGVTVGGTPQASGTTANDFTNPLTYTVTAQDGSTKDYTATVTNAAPFSAWNLTVTAASGGTTNPSGTVSAGNGAATSVSATPNTGYFFSGWTVASGSGVSFGSAASAGTTVTLASGDAAIQANFTVLSPIPLVTIGAAGDSFTMGDGTYGPGVTQSLTYGFQMSKYEITNAQFAQFLADGGYATQSYWTTNGWARTGSISGPAYWADAGFNGNSQPVVGVSWYEAVTFCNWRSVKEGLTPAYNAAGHGTTPLIPASARHFATNAVRRSATAIAGSV